MASFLETLAGRIARLHALRVYRRFLRSLGRMRYAQQQSLERALDLVSGSAFAQDHALAGVRTLADLRKALPILNYEHFRPYIDRVAAGETTALFRRRQRVLMFATSSGTTAQRKLVPVTPEFVRDYRRGWNTFGVKVLSDHSDAFMRAILQSTARHDEGHTSSGVPFGAITGLLARSQKGIVRRFYVGHPCLARLDDARARYYALMRCGATRDVAFAITANPATLIRLAQTADDESERLIRDVADGTLDETLVADRTVIRDLAPRLRPDPERARELRALRERHGALRPRDLWDLKFVACWTGGSMGHYLERLRQWWGPSPVRDIGLLASEGRVSIPLEDESPAGALDVGSACFEFIPAEQAASATPDALEPHELELGQKYIVVLTNLTGLIRYRLDDVVRVTGWLEQAPVIEFLYRAGRVASVAGEKLTENQLVAAVTMVRERLGLHEFDFRRGPRLGRPAVLHAQPHGDRRRLRPRPRLRPCRPE